MPIEVQTQDEREQCEAIADGWMTDMNARAKLASVIATARAAARREALAGAAVVADSVAEKYRADASATHEKEEHDWASGASRGAADVATNIRKVLR